MTELKEKLISIIRQNDDEELLKEIYNLLKSESATEVLHLSQAQIEKIRKSEKCVADGKLISDEEAQKRINKWLEE